MMFQCKLTHYRKGESMKREEMITIVSQKMKLIRTEYNYTQEQMADILGISKKTLVQIEKQRIECGWTVAVAVCTLFRNSMILQTALGGNPLMFISLIANEGLIHVDKNEVNDKLWWRTIENKTNWRIQQNLVHTCFRILNPEGRIIFYTFSKDIALEEFQKHIF